MKPHTNPHGLRKQHGMMLLEALFGILLFSIGIIALVGMQTSAVKQSVESKYRSDASLLAVQLIGQLWGTDRQFSTLNSRYNSSNISGGICNSSCAPDFSNWLETVKSSLPGASTRTPTIQFTQVATSTSSAASTRVTITIFWQSPGADSAVHNYVAIAEIK